MAVIAIDFDSTIVEGDKPLEGAKDAINLLREHGHKVVIHSCNNTKWIEKVLNNADIRYDYIWPSESGGGKPVCDLYLDDKGYHFRGKWKDEINEVLARLEGPQYKKVEIL